MKIIYTLLIILVIFRIGYSQNNSGKYYNLLRGSEGSDFMRIELSSDIDTTWEKWKQRGYNFGFNPKLTPMYSTINGILSTPYMIQVRGNEIELNKKRWGFHLFEGYAKDDKSRITMLVNKHVELDKPVAELYYYSTVYNESEPAYNWFRIGSDVKQHSFLFSRDKAVFYGSLKLSNALTLGNIGKEDILKEPPRDVDESLSEESAKHVNFKALKEGADGTMFYDKDKGIVVIKVNGQWMKMSVEPLPQGVKYEF